MSWESILKKEERYSKTGNQRIEERGLINVSKLVKILGDINDITAPDGDIREALKTVTTGKADITKLRSSGQELFYYTEKVTDMLGQITDNLTLGR